jgi:hypothetical protein
MVEFLVAKVCIKENPRKSEESSKMQKKILDLEFSIVQTGSSTSHFRPYLPLKLPPLLRPTWKRKENEKRKPENEMKRIEKKYFIAFFFPNFYKKY